MATTKISWCDKVWNPITGCTKISAGCTNCYAEKMAKRLAGRFGYPKDDSFAVMLHEERMCPSKLWRDGDRIFVNSMGDLFHDDVDPYDIMRLFNIMERSKGQTFLILTKRPENMLAFYERLRPGVVVPGPHFAITGKGDGYAGSPPDLPRNIWLGVTAENQEMADERIPILLQIPAAVRFVSVEPLLSPLNLTDWLPELATPHQVEYNPIYNGSANESRERNISGCFGRRASDRQRGSNLEGCGTPLGQMEQDDESHCLCPQTSGELHRRISASEGDVQREKDTRVGTPACLQTFPRPDSRGLDCESQGRNQRPQSPGQPGACDYVGAADTCCPGAKEGPCCQPERNQEQHGETNPSTGSRDSQASSDWRNAGVDSSGLRRSLPNNLQDSPRRPLGVISWVICGGETGHHARPAHPDWFRKLRDDCRAAGVPFFFKSHGKHFYSKENKHLLDGIEHHEFPEVAR